MLERVIKFWEDLQQRIWVIPALASIIGVVGAMGLVTLDRESEAALRLPLVPIVQDAANARELMSTVAGTFIGAAASLFSITLVAMTLASQQYGPRLLGNFMSDRISQAVLATFIGGAAYCLVVLWAVEDGATTFVPSSAVSVGMAWAFAGLGVMIYFLYHIAESMRLSRILSNITESMELAIELMYPSTIGSSSPVEGAGEAYAFEFEREARPIYAKGSGYVQTVAGSQVLDLASERDLVITLQLRPGQFMSPGMEIARVYPSSAQLEDEIVDGIADSFLLGLERSPAQDIEFLFQKLCDIANKALSPAVNDPYTAIMSIDRMGLGIVQVLQEEPVDPVRYDDEGRVRVIARGATSLAVLLDTCFESVRHYAATDLKVLIRIIEVLGDLAPHLRTNEERELTRSQLERTLSYIRRLDSTGWNISQGVEAYGMAVERLSPTP
ncbi:MAG: DUF2254 domain-containing protein [Myxococcota bacterium]